MIKFLNYGWDNPDIAIKNIMPALPVVVYLQNVKRGVVSMGPDHVEPYRGLACTTATRGEDREAPQKTSLLWCRPSCLGCQHSYNSTACVHLRACTYEEDSCTWARRPEAPVGSSAVSRAAHSWSSRLLKSTILFAGYRSIAVYLSTRSRGVHRVVVVKRVPSQIG